MEAWWGCMIGLNVIIALVYIFWCYKSIKSDPLEPENKRYKTIMRILGAIFVFVSLYRSIFVSSYPKRLAWVDSMANSMIVIRVLATFAEISYSLIIGLALAHLNKEMPADCKFARSKVGGILVKYGPYTIIACLCIAQFFAYSGLFTQHLTLFAVEETLWTAGFASIIPVTITQCRNVFKNHKDDKSAIFIKVFLVMLATFSIGYVLYQLFYSLPFTYYTQIAADLQKPHLSGMEAINKAVYDFTVTHDYETWGGIGFFIWHTGYFSLCTIMNMLFAMAPRFLKNRK